MNWTINDSHVSANNPGISHQGLRDTCQFGDCIARRVRYEVLAKTASPAADVARLQRWMATASAEELRIARLVVTHEPTHGWARNFLEGR